MRIRLLTAIAVLATFLGPQAFAKKSKDAGKSPTTAASKKKPKKQKKKKKSASAQHKHRSPART